MSTDTALLRRYAVEHDEPAFAELVRRHLNLVYAAALRQTGGRTHLAEEIAQKVFSDLARKAAALVHHPALTGWLYRSTRYAAIDAVRSELSRQKLAQSFTAMPDASFSPEPIIDWEQLRPVLDAAMDQLKEQDRELMLLHYFNGLTFAEAGARLHLSAEAARRRTARALEQLRAQLGKRGVTSTTAALGLLLANQPMVAAPAGLAATVSATALAAAPTGVAASLASLLFMSKITAPALSAALAAGLTAVVWTSVAQTTNPEELAALRSENARLTQATAAGASADSIAAVADEYAAQATAIARAMAQRQAQSAIEATAGSTTQPEVTARGHSNHGQATAYDAVLTFAWACDICDPDELGKIVYMDAKAREQAAAALATMPEEIRAQYPTPEKFYGLLLAASCLEAPPPGIDFVKHFEMVEVSPGRAVAQLPGQKRGTREFQQTPDGWKYVFPEAGVKSLPGILNSETLAKLAKP